MITKLTYLGIVRCWHNTMFLGWNVFKLNIIIQKVILQKPEFNETLYDEILLNQM